MKTEEEYLSPENLELRKKRSQLAEIRRLNVAPEANPGRKPKVIRYVPAKIWIRPGFLLDPLRRVSPHWEKTDYDGAMLYIDTNRRAGEQVDMGDGFGVCEDDRRYRVRCIAGPRIGEVIEVNAVEYTQLRGDFQMRGPERCSHEPVPSNEPLKGPILPPDFPTNIDKARSLAALALKKDGAKLSFGDMIKFFTDFVKSPVLEVVK